MVFFFQKKDGKTKRNFELFSSEFQKCGLIVGLIWSKNPEVVENQLLRDYLSGDNRIRTDDLLHAMQAL